MFYGIVASLALERAAELPFLKGGTARMVLHSRVKAS